MDGRRGDGHGPFRIEDDETASEAADVRAGRDAHHVHEGLLGVPGVGRERHPSGPWGRKQVGQGRHPVGGGLVVGDQQNGGAALDRRVHRHQQSTDRLLGPGAEPGRGPSSVERSRRERDPGQTRVGHRPVGPEGGPPQFGRQRLGTLVQDETVREVVARPPRGIVSTGDHPAQDRNAAQVGRVTEVDRMPMDLLRRQGPGRLVDGEAFHLAQHSCVHTGGGGVELVTGTTGQPPFARGVVELG